MKEITVTLKEKVDFSLAEVGDLVFCVADGVGKIVNICKSNTYPLLITFDGKDNTHTATMNGKWHSSNKYASIYFFNPDRQEVLYERPDPGIDWTEYEEKEIETRDNDGECWQIRTLCKYAPKFSKSFLCYSLDKNAVVPWKQARLIKEDS